MQGVDLLAVLERVQERRERPQVECRRADVQQVIVQPQRLAAADISIDEVEEALSVLAFGYAGRSEAPSRAAFAQAFTDPAVRARLAGNSAGTTRPSSASFMQAICWAPRAARREAPSRPSR